jgi:hypothetical protein
MMRSDLPSARWTGPILFAVPAALAFLAIMLTRVPGLGPGVAAAWASAGLGAGHPADAHLAPFYGLLLRLAGMAGSPEGMIERANLVSAIGGGLVAGFAALALRAALRRALHPAPGVLGAFGGLVIALGSPVWAASLVPGPAPWAVAALAAAAWLLERNPEGAPSLRSSLLGFFLSGLAVSLHLGAILALPLLASLPGARTLRGRGLVVGTALLMLPLFLFLLPLEGPLLAVRGLFAAPRGIPTEKTGIAFVAALALNPITAVPALWGLAVLVRRSSLARIQLAAALALMVVGGVLPWAWEMAGILAGVLVGLLAAWGVSDLFARIPRTLAPLAWLLLVGLLIAQVPRVDRHNETLWRAHAYNAYALARYESVILSPDEEALNVPFHYLRAAEDLRPDLTILNPLRLLDARYLEEVRPRILPLADSAAAEHFQRLDRLVGEEAPRQARLQGLNRFLAHWVDTMAVSFEKDRGVLVSPGYRPPTSLELLPEGLLLRVWDGEEEFPFIFRSLDLEPIRHREGATPLERRIVSLYPMMFTERARWMLAKRYTLEGQDYLRWALKIDPDYLPARILAREYGVHGEPQKLLPRRRWE